MNVRPLLLPLLLGSATPALAFRAGSMPAQVQVANSQLTLTGSAVQRKLWFKVYEISLYLEEPTRDAREAISSEQLKHLHLRIFRDAEPEQIASSLLGGLRATVPPSQMAALENRVARVVDAIPPMSKGDDLFITYVPGRGTEVLVPGKASVHIPGKDFADAMLSIWLGGEAHMREQLLGRRAG